MFVLVLALMQGPTKPVMLRYRIEAHTTSEQDLTAAGKGKLSGSLTTTSFVTVALTDSAEGQIAKITVDSMKLEPTGKMLESLPLNAAATVADSARGAFVRAFTVRGSVKGTPQGSNQNPALNTIFQTMGVLFPGLRSNIKVGDGWADTTNINNQGQGGKQLGRVIATWKVMGMENGGFVLDGTANTDVTTTSPNGQSLHVTGSSQEHLVMASRGPTRTASIQTGNKALLVTPQNPAGSPGTTQATLKVIPIS